MGTNELAKNFSVSPRTIRVVAKKLNSWGKYRNCPFDESLYPQEVAIEIGNYLIQHNLGDVDRIEMYQGFFRNEIVRRDKEFERRFRCRAC